MREEFFNAFVEEFLEKGNEKIKEVSLDIFLSNKDVSDLFRFYNYQLLIEQRYDDIEKSISFKNDKEKIIKHIKDSLENILKNLIITAHEEDLETLKFVIKRLKENNYDFSDMHWNFNFIEFIKGKLLATTEFNRKKGALKIFLPKEIVDILDDLINSEMLLETNKKYNEIIHYLVNALNVYGIISANKLHTMFEKNMYKIDKNILIHCAHLEMYLNDIICIHYSDKMLICNMEFDDEDYANSFYDDQTGKYKEYTKKELESFENGHYLDSLKEYHDIINFFEDRYDLDNEAYDYIKNFIVMEYIINSQTFSELSEESFKNNVLEYFDMNREDLRMLKRLVRKVFEKYPKWRKRGNI